MGYEKQENRIINYVTALLVAGFYIFDMNSLISVILLAGTGLIAFLIAFENAFRIRFHLEKFHINIIVFALFCLLSSVWSISPSLSIENTTTIIELLICMSVLYLHYSEYDSIDDLYYVIMVGGMIVAFYTIYAYGIDTIVYTIGAGGRLNIKFSNINSIALICTLSSIVYVYRALFSKATGFQMVFFGISSFVSIIIIAATGSRKALIMLVVSIVALFMIRFKSKSVVNSIISAIIVGILSFFIIRFLASYTVLKNNNYLQRIVNTRRHLRRANVDAVISFLETPNFLSCISAIGKHRWVLITSERNAKEYEFTNRRGKIMKWFERYSDWTVCNSNVARELWKKYYPQYKDRVSTIYNPVIINEVNSLCRPERKRKRIVIAASYQRLKNPLGLLEALHLLSDEERSQLSIDWYGRAEPIENDGVYEEACSLCAEYQLQDCITFHGENKQIYREMMDADAVALFSEVEGLPNTICEGMMCGKPILMSRMSDYNTFVTSENGFLCDAKDPETIAEAIRKFLSLTPERQCQMGKRSYELAVQLFDVERNVGQWETLLQTLVAGKIKK